MWLLPKIACAKIHQDIEYIITELKLHNNLEVIKRHEAEKYKNSAVEMWCYGKYQTTVVLDHFCPHIPK